MRLPLLHFVVDDQRTFLSFEKMELTRDTTLRRVSFHIAWACACHIAQCAVDDVYDVKTIYYSRVFLRFSPK